MRRELLLLTLSFTSIACGSAERVVEAPPPRFEAPPPLAPHLALERFAGTYALGGAAVADGCAGDLVLAARNAVIDPMARTLRADVVDRVYPARVEGEALIAEDRFDAPNACPQSTLYERWVLERSGPSELRGTLTSTWLLPPDCVHPCTVVFEITATSN